MNYKIYRNFTIITFIIGLVLIIYGSSNLPGEIPGYTSVYSNNDPSVISQQQAAHQTDLRNYQIQTVEFKIIMGGIGTMCMCAICGYITFRKHTQMEIEAEQKAERIQRNERLRIARNSAKILPIKNEPNILEIKRQSPLHDLLLEQSIEKEPINVESSVHIKPIFNNKEFKSILKKTTPPLESSPPAMLVPSDNIKKILYHPLQPHPRTRPYLQVQRTNDSLQQFILQPKQPQPKQPQTVGYRLPYKLPPSYQEYYNRNPSRHVYHLKN